MLKKITRGQASHLVSEQQDRPLSRSGRASLRVPLGMCAGCVRISGQMDFLRRAMARYAGRDSAPGEGPRD